MQILAYNRLVKDLDGKRPGELIEAVGKTHQLTPGPAVPARQGEVSMFVAGHWFTVPLKRSSGHSPSDSLDVSLLHDQILAPCLGDRRRADGQAD